MGLIGFRPANWTHFNVYGPPLAAWHRATVLRRWLSSSLRLFKARKHIAPNNICYKFGIIDRPSYSNAMHWCRICFFGQLRSLHACILLVISSLTLTALHLQFNLHGVHRGESSKHGLTSLWFEGLPMNVRIRKFGLQAYSCVESIDSTVHYVYTKEAYTRVERKWGQNFFWKS